MKRCATERSPGLFLEPHPHSSNLAARSPHRADAAEIAAGHVSFAGDSTTKRVTARTFKPSSTGNVGGMEII